MDILSKGRFAFLQDLPDYQGLPENNTKKELDQTQTINNNECHSDFKNAFDEIKEMNLETDAFYKINVDFYKDKCQIL